ncbi:MAG: glutaredoxin family protein [candidate division WOR-3 bacterium]|jgi:glutaredoxin 3
MTIKLYTNSSCPHCTRAKKFLKDHDIKFKEINISRYPEAAKELKEKTGQTGVPVILFGNHKIVGFDENKLKRLLNIK